MLCTDCVSVESGCKGTKFFLIYKFFFIPNVISLILNTSYLLYFHANRHLYITYYYLET